MQLRDYQLQAVSDLRKALKKHRSALYCLPTGGGKSAIMGEIARLLALRKKQTLLLVHKDELVAQLCEHLWECGLGEEYGVIQAGKPVTPWKLFHVAMVQTLYRRMKSLRWLNPDAILVDEAHHAKALTWETVLDYWMNAKVVGFTATPRRLDNKPLGDIFSSLVLGPDMKTLISRGLLCPIHIKSIPGSLDADGVNITAGEFNKKQMNDRVNAKVIGEAASAYMRYAEGKRAIFFGQSIQHSEGVAERLRERGVRAKHVDGKTDRYARAAIINDYKRGDLDVLCNVGIATEGVDIPSCAVVILGRPTASLTFYRQAIGRGTRPDHGKTLLVLDLANNWARHGTPDTEPPWDLHTKVDTKTVNRNPAVPHFRVCPSCATVYANRLPACPNCGESKPTKQPDERDIPLVDVYRSSMVGRSIAPPVTREDLHAMLIRSVATNEGRAGLERIRKQQGYSDDWVDRMAHVLEVK